MRRFLYSACLFSAIIPLKTSAQLGESDALRYSQDILGGTARFAAMGGAFCAVGGDLSTLGYNPAGIAVYTQNQLEITPGIAFQSTNTSYNGTSTTSTNSAATLQSLGFVATGKVRNKSKDDNGGWKSYNFGIVYNRLNNFNDNVTLQGYTNKSTLLDDLTSEANGTNYNNLNNIDAFRVSPAWQTYLLDTLPNSNGSEYMNLIQPSLDAGAGNILQTENIQTTGSMGETDISFGGNYNNRLFIGGTIGIVDASYNLTDTYSEQAEYNDATYGFSNYTFTQNLNTSGTGVNFKLGVIYRIFDWLRVGGAINSPTYFSMTDNYSTYWIANYSTATVYNGDQAGPVAIEQPVQTSYNYNLTTPMKAIVGAAAVIHGQGIVSADYEYVNYSTINVNSSDLGSGYTAPLNTAISQDFIQANNLRLGFEWVLYPISLRAGYGIYGNPYNQSTVGYTSVRNTYSLGVGLKVNHVAFDLAYTLMQYSEQYQPYSEANPATLKTNISNVILTMAYTFDSPKNRPHRRRYSNYPPPPPPPPPGAY